MLLVDFPAGVVQLVDNYLLVDFLGVGKVVDYQEASALSQLPEGEWWDLSKLVSKACIDSNSKYATSLPIITINTVHANRFLKKTELLLHIS